MTRRLLSPLLLAAALAAARPAPAPAPALIARVAAAFGARWHVAPRDVRLVWGRATGAGVPDPTAGFVLLPAGGGWFSLVVPARGAPDTVHWPVRAGVAESVLVARHALARNVALAAADVRDSVIVQWGGPSRAHRGRLGWRTQRPIAVGEPLTTPAVDAPPLIAAGDSVQFVWARPGIRIVLPGIAVGRAVASGDRLIVRLSQGRTLAGIAAGPHRVQAISK
jgi:flagella basal body P-ring formation protein FlgA